VKNGNTLRRANRLLMVPAALMLAACSTSPAGAVKEKTPEDIFARWRAGNDKARQALIEAGPAAFVFVREKIERGETEEKSLGHLLWWMRSYLQYHHGTLDSDSIEFLVRKLTTAPTAQRFDYGKVLLSVAPQLVSETHVKLFEERYSKEKADDLVRLVLVRLIGAFGGKEADKFLHDVVENESETERVRWAATVELAKRGHAASLEQVCERLHPDVVYADLGNKRWGDRQNALKTLKTIEDRRSVASIAKLLYDPAKDPKTGKRINSIYDMRFKAIRLLLHILREEPGIPEQVSSEEAVKHWQAWWEKNKNDPRYHIDKEAK